MHTASRPAPPVARRRLIILNRHGNCHFPKGTWAEAVWAFQNIWYRGQPRNPHPLQIEIHISASPPQPSTTLAFLSSADQVNSLRKGHTFGSCYWIHDDLFFALIDYDQLPQHSIVRRHEYLDKIREFFSSESKHNSLVGKIRRAVQAGRNTTVSPPDRRWRHVTFCDRDGHLLFSTHSILNSNWSAWEHSRTLSRLLKKSLRSSTDPKSWNGVDGGLCPSITSGQPIQPFPELDPTKYEGPGEAVIQLENGFLLLEWWGPNMEHPSAPLFICENVVSSDGEWEPITSSSPPAQDRPLEVSHVVDLVPRTLEPEPSFFYSMDRKQLDILTSPSSNPFHLTHSLGNTDWGPPPLASTSSHRPFQATALADHSSQQERHSSGIQSPVSDNQMSFHSLDSHGPPKSDYSVTSRVTSYPPMKFTSAAGSQRSFETPSERYPAQHHYASNAPPPHLVNDPGAYGHPNMTTSIAKPSARHSTMSLPTTSSAQGGRIYGQPPVPRSHPYSRPPLPAASSTSQHFHPAHSTPYYTEPLQRFSGQFMRSIQGPSAQSLDDSATRRCAQCHKTNSRTWRRGPSGKVDLCNSCGQRWMRQRRKLTKPLDPTEAASAAVSEIHDFHLNQVDAQTPYDSALTESTTSPYAPHSNKDMPPGRFLGRFTQ